jgi:hypothetical protein
VNGGRDDRDATENVGGDVLVRIMRRRYDGIALDVFLIAIDVFVVGVAGLAIGYWW